MHNPWTEIPYEDYEGHMSAPHVGQSVVVADLTREALEKYPPRSFALLGACTGNGLQHIDTSVTSQVYCVDINNSFLEVIRRRYADSIPGLQLLCSDLDWEVPPVKDACLVMAALLIEYVDPYRLLQIIKGMLAPHGTARIVMQKSMPGARVVPSGFSSLDMLNDFGGERDEHQVIALAAECHLNLLEKKELLLSADKKFIVMDLIHQKKNLSKKDS